MSDDEKKNSVASEEEVAIYERFLRALGLITVNFSSLEHQISMHIASLLCYAVKPSDREGTFYLRMAQLMTAELSFYKLLALFDSFFKHVEKDADCKAKMSELIKRASNLADQRNLIVHSAWGTSLGARGKMLRFKTTAKIEKNRPTNLKSTMVTVEVEDVERLADELWEVGLSIEALMRKDDSILKNAFVID